MPRRIKQKPSLLSPAGNLIKRLSDTDIRLRRKILRGSLWGLGVLFAYGLMFGEYSIPRIVRLTLQKQALIATNRDLTTQLLDADRVRKLLQSDAAYIESVARTRYYMVRPNETIYRYRGR
jgi:cell division protein FtsB